MGLKLLAMKIIGNTSQWFSKSYYKPYFKWCGLVLILLLTMVAIFFLQSAKSPNFSEVPAGAERKQAFVSYLLPIIQEQNAQALEQRDELLEWYGAFQEDDLGWFAKRSVTTLAEQYELADFDVGNNTDWLELQRRVDVIPPSLALAQAANESAWGTSRFAEQGNNFYGEWCFVQGCGLVPKNRGSGKAHEVAVFESPAESVKAYIDNLNTHRAYESLRKIRDGLRQQDKTLAGTQLAKGLQSYSERGTEYIDDIVAMIRFNKFDRFDH